MTEIRVELQALAGVVGRRDLLNTEWANGEPSHDFEERRGRCYELVGYALAFGSAPPDALTVHGSWRGPGATRRIGHAWLTWQGFVWEPVTAGWYEARSFTEVVRLREERVYTQPELRKQLLIHNHYGRWHESEHP